ncbi:hypothetical protein SAMN05216338_1005120 [Bradyrhizobium sp. Rc2d]|nr:hypothetical protein SAMN05216338_1005120 [Bradyrhizobium sp. Rc2d]
MDKTIWLIEVHLPKPHRLESVANSPADGSTGRLLAQWANDRAGVHDVRWIKGAFDPAHRRDTPDITVPFQKVPFKTADAVLRAERAAERRGRVVELQIVGSLRRCRTLSREAFGT